MATIRSKLGHLTERDMSRHTSYDTAAHLVFLLTFQNGAETGFLGCLSTLLTPAELLVSIVKHRCYIILVWFYFWFPVKSCEIENVYEYAT